MTIEEIIRKWYALASGGNVEANDIFFRFVALWIAFNALYTSRHGNEERDWDQVRSFAEAPQAIACHRRLLQNDEKYRNAVQDLKDRGVYDVRRQTLRTIRNENNLTQVARCVYQVRCNLFHGGKSPEDLRDERLVNAGYTIISKLIWPYLNSN